jgi:aryl-alcohol dehydrogenase-like predicted oxidoreductase
VRQPGLNEAFTSLQFPRCWFQPAKLCHRKGERGIGLKLGLGTAQFGLDYGITNKSGKVPSSIVASILQFARSHAVDVVDTAVAYGTSEEVLGQNLRADDAFKIVTKTSPIKRAVVTQNDARLVSEKFMLSLARLGQPKVYGLLVHNPQDLLALDSEVLMAEMMKLKQAGFVEKIGVSVYSGAEVDEIISRHEIDLIQVPINVFDQRLVASGHLKQLKDLRVEIHARSVFLQGLLLLTPAQLPAKFEKLRSPLENYGRYLANYGLTPIEGTLAFLKQLGMIDYLIVGVLSVANLAEICAAMKTPRSDQLNFSSFALSDRAILDPTMWDRT